MKKSLSILNGPAWLFVMVISLAVQLNSRLQGASPPSPPFCGYYVAPCPDQMDPAGCGSEV